MGLRDGDKIVSIDHKPVEDFGEVRERLLLDGARSVQVMRCDTMADIPIPEDFVSRMIKANNPDFITYRFPFVVGDFAPGSAAKEAGLLQEDRIIGINDSMSLYFNQFRAFIQEHKNQKVDIRVVRGQDTLMMPVDVPAAGLIGVQPKSPALFLDFAEKHYSVISAIPAGIIKTFEGAGNYLKSMKVLFTQEKAYESVGGFITIGSVFPSDWDWVQFWSLTAFLSIMLAILNVLPIPALDGGHVMFLFYEIIFRRKPSDKFMEYAQVAGMVILFGLLIFANGQDILKLFR